MVDKKDPKLNWYSIHSQAGHEKKIARVLKQRVKAMDLEDKIKRIVVPTQNKIVIRNGQKKEIKERLFPGYIFVQMVLNDATWRAVRSTEGVTGFVGIGDNPTPLPPEEVDRILKFMEMEAPKFEAKFEIGENVKITEGPFADFVGEVEELDKEKGRVKVLVSIFGRETPVDLDLVQVKPL